MLKENQKVYTALNHLIIFKYNNKMSYEYEKYIA